MQAKEGFRHFRGSEGLVEAAAERFRGFKGLKAGKRQAANSPNKRRHIVPAVKGRLQCWSAETA